MVEKKIGIFDPEGKKDNPLTGKPYQNLYEESDTLKNDKGEEIPGTYKNYAKIVHDQPLLKDIKQSYDILDKLRNHQVLVIESATGTGKTVVLPKLASHLFDYKELVVVTVPKKSLAESSGKFCAKCMDVRLGDEVGFAHSEAKIVDKFITEEGIEIEEDRKGHSSKSKIIFATDGWLASKLKNNLTMEGYGLIMIDEVHERNERIDILLVKIRDALLLNPKLKVIITSATLEMDLFVNYFEEKGISVASKTVSGETNFKVEPFFENVKITPMNIVKETVGAYEKYLYKKNSKEDCIIFVNSNNNAKKVCDELTKMSRKIYCIVATSTTISYDDDLEKKAAENPSKNPYLKELYEREGYDRRVIVATDVWESSVTLPLLKFVIDSGMALTTSYNGDKMMNSLLNKQIAEGQALQRLGRVGRRSPGTCIFLYSEKVYDKMEPQKEPGILREDFTKYILDFWIMDNNETLRNVVNYIMNLIATPKSEVIRNGFRNLYALGYSTGDKNGDDELTEMGFYLAHKDYNINNDIRHTKAYYYANIYNCRDEVALILSFFSLKKGIADMFVECKNANDKEHCKRQLFQYRNEYGDMVAAYKAFLAYLDQERNEKFYDSRNMERWCKKNYVSCDQLKRVLKNYKRTFFPKRKDGQLFIKKFPLVLFDESGEKRIKFDSLFDKISYCMLKGFYINLAEKKGKNYKNLFPSIKTIKPINDIITVSNSKKFNFLSKDSRYVIYNELREFDNSTTFMDTMGIPVHIVNLLTDFEKEMVGII